MTEDTNDRAVIGGNNPPPFTPESFAKATDAAKGALAVAKVQVELGPIDNKERAGDVTDAADKISRAAKIVESLRVEQKAPHDAAATAVQKAFTPILQALKDEAGTLKKMAGAWIIAETARVEAERVAKETAAREAQEAAWAEQRMAEARGDTLAAAASAAEAKDADKAVAAASKPVKVAMTSGHGGARSISMRKVKTVEIKVIRSLFIYFQDHQDVRDVLGRLATAEVRAAGYVDGTIPGIDVLTTEVPA